MSQGKCFTVMLNFFSFSLLRRKTFFEVKKNFLPVRGSQTIPLIEESEFHLIDVVHDEVLFLRHHAKDGPAGTVVTHFVELKRNEKRNVVQMISTFVPDADPSYFRLKVEKYRIFDARTF